MLLSYNSVASTQKGIVNYIMASWWQKALNPPCTHTHPKKKK